MVFSDISIFLLPIIFGVAFLIVFVIIFIFVFKNMKTNMKIAEKELEKELNETQDIETQDKITSNVEQKIKNKFGICEYCGSSLDKNGKCESCGAVKKK